MIEEPINTQGTIALPADGIGSRLRRVNDFVSNWLAQPLLVGVIALVASLIYVWTPASVAPTFDDSYISLTFARNLAEHGKMGFDAEHWTTGATSPLHVFTVAWLIRSGLSPVD